MFDKELALRLKELRLSKNLTQQAVADELGITRSAYTYYEMGKTQPNIQSLLILSKIYEMKIDDIINP